MGTSTLQLQLASPLDHCWAHIAYDKYPVVMENGDVDGDWDERVFNPRDGWVGFMGCEDGRTAYVIVRAPGRVTLEVPPISLPAPSAAIRLPMPIFETPGRLVRAGTRLVTASGLPWFGKGASFFRGYEKYLDRGFGAIERQIAQLAELGCNTLDVWSMYHYLKVNDRPDGDGAPFNMHALGPRAYHELAPFHEEIGRYGMGSLWVGFCDPALVEPTLGGQQDHWFELSQALSLIDNVSTIILNNEHDAHDFNRVDRSKFPAPASHPGMCSSWGEWDGQYADPRWSVFGYHHPRSFPKVITDACVANYPGQLAYGLPVWLDEPIRVDARFADDGAQSVESIEKMAGTAKATAAGIVYHSQQGKHAELYDAYTLERARAFFRALA